MDFNGLIAQVVDTLGSQVTTAQATALLPLVEARFNRIIDSPEREIEYSWTPDGTDALPSDCWRLRDMWLAGSPDSTLRAVSPDMGRTLYGTDTGNFVAYTVTGRTLYFWPAATSTNTAVVHIRYQQTIPALSATNVNNWLLTSYPDVYYYGLLVQCEAYIVNDERIPLWKSALEEAVGELIAETRRLRYGASPLVRRATVSA